MDINGLHTIAEYSIAQMACLWHSAETISRLECCPPDILCVRVHPCTPVCLSPGVALAGTTTSRTASTPCAPRHSPFANDTVRPDSRRRSVSPRWGCRRPCHSGQPAVPHGRSLGEPCSIPHVPPGQGPDPQVSRAEMLECNYDFDCGGRRRRTPARRRGREHEPHLAQVPSPCVRHGDASEPPVC